MILSICAQEVDELNFNVYNSISQQTYTESGIDLENDVTVATLTFNKVNGSAEDAFTIDIGEDFHFLFETGGLTINFADFGEDTMFDLDYFADWLYEIDITYEYLGVSYTASTTVGFKSRIVHIIYQQMLQANWKKELACTCSCDSNSTTLRKWDYLAQMEAAADLCMINEYLTILQALYKLTGTTHEFQT